MATDVKGFKAHAVLAIGALFTTATHFGINITIIGGTNAQAAADVAITDTARNRGTGAEVAADLQTAIQTLSGISTATVTWANFAFTIDGIDCTSITIAPPTDDVAYADGTELLFGKTDTQTGTTWTGNHPQNCTVEAALPSDYSEGSLELVHWDGYELAPWPPEWTLNNDAHGDPYLYSVRDRYLRLIPSPTRNAILEIWYRSIPAEIASGAFDTALPTNMPTRLHGALSYLLASKMAEGNNEEQLAALRHRHYWQLIASFKADRANEITMGKTWQPPRQKQYRVSPTDAD